MRKTLLNRISENHIQAAGPRYSPALDPRAPNLTIQPLLSAVESFALTNKYKDSILTLEHNLVSAWNQTSKETIALLSARELPTQLVSLLTKLRREKVGRSQKTLNRIGQLSEKIVTKLDEKQRELWQQEQGLEEYSEE